MTRLRRLAGPAVLLVLTIAFYWKLTLTDQYIWFDHPDQSFLELPRMQFQAREIHRARFPLWDPYFWCGQSLIGQTQPGPLFPLNLAFSLLPLDKNGYLRNDMLNWYYAVVHFLAALFAYLFCRELRLPEAASIFGGILFGFGGFLGTVPWTDVMNGAIFAPIVLLYLVRAGRGKRPIADSALAGFWLGISWLSGHHELPLMLSVIAAATWIWLRLFRAAAICFVIAGLIAAVQLWPTYEFAHLSKRFVGAEKEAAWNDRVPYTVHTVYSLPASGVVETMLPNAKTYADVAPFMGGIAVSLALIGFAANRRDRYVRWLAVVAVVSLVYALGAFTPLHGLVYAISPMMARARVPVRAILFWNCALAVLAAYGLAAPPEWLRRIGKFMAHRTLPRRRECGRPDRPLPDRADRPRAGRVDAVRHRVVPPHHRRQSGEIRFSTDARPRHRRLPSRPARPRPHRGQRRGSARQLRRLARPRDAARLRRRRPGVAGRRAHAHRAVPPDGQRDALRRPAARLPEPDGNFPGRERPQVFRVPDPMPRAYSVHNAVAVTTMAEASARVQDPAFDFRTTVTLPGAAPQLDSCSGDAVRITRHGADHVTIRAKMACRGMIVLGDSWYPGWRAKIDGRPAPIYQAYGTLRGVVAEAGEHELDMRYLPASVLGGAGLSMVGLIAGAVMIITANLRK